MSTVSTNTTAYRPFTNATAVAAPIQTAAPVQATAPAAATTTAAPTDTVKMLDATAAPPEPPKPSPQAQAMADGVFNDVIGNAGPRQAFANYNADARNEFMNQQMKDPIKSLNAQLLGGTLSVAEYESRINSLANQVESQANAKFGPVPKNPDAAPAPSPAYNWQGRAEAEAAAVKSLVDNVLAEFRAGRIPADQIDKVIDQRAVGIQNQLNAQFGQPPEIISPLAGTPQQQEYKQKLQAAMKVETDALVKGVMNGTVNPNDLERLIDQKTKDVIAQLGPEPPGWQFDPSKDTPEIFAQNRYQMEQQLDSMRARGATPQEIATYQTQRIAELTMAFPKQTYLEDTKAQWKATALEMQKAGKSETEIRDFLNQKALEYKEPSPEELQAYQQRVTKQATDMLNLMAAIGGGGSSRGSSMSDFIPGGGNPRDDY